MFTTNGTAPSSGYSKGKRRLDALLPSDMPPWRLHDLRRTVASGMARLGINLPVIEKVLNHSSGSFAGIVSVYQKHSFADEKRAALDAWGQHVERLVGWQAGEGRPTTPQSVTCLGLLCRPLVGFVCRPNCLILFALCRRVAFLKPIKPRVRRFHRD